MNNGIFIYFAVLIMAIALWWFYTGASLPSAHPSTATTTVTGGSNTPQLNTTTIASNYIYNCNPYSLYTSGPNQTVVGHCSWKGGFLGLWVASGSSAYERLTIVGADQRTYMNQTSNYQCNSFFANFSAPPQTYTLTLRSGATINSSMVNQNCARTIVDLNTTLNPPATSKPYPDVYNGRFSNGAYTGWTTSGRGFGNGPLNITYANTNQTSQCYIGQPWQGYNGTFFATTFNCGTSSAPGNLTSSLFYANKPFLNFRIISPQDNFLYVEILYNNTPYIIAHYNTYNISSGANATSTFRTATIPLVTVINKPIQIKIFADTLTRQSYIAVGDFALANKPIQSSGILDGPYNFVH